MQAARMAAGPVRPLRQNLTHGNDEAVGNAAMSGSALPVLPRTEHNLLGRVADNICYNFCITKYRRCFVCLAYSTSKHLVTRVIRITLPPLVAAPFCVINYCGPSKHTRCKVRQRSCVRDNGPTGDTRSESARFPALKVVRRVIDFIQYIKRNRDFLA